MRLVQPIWPRFFPTRIVLGAATLGPIGRRLPAPGTWGSLAGLMYFTVFFYPLSTLGTILWSLPALYLAVAFCGEAEFRMARRDPGEVILDEFVVMPLCFLGWRSLLPLVPAWAIFMAGFGLFRLYDITKPFGIKKLQDWPAGWGVVVDDLAAALATCATLHGAAAAWRYWH